jgi:hypothetical protein
MTLALIPPSAGRTRVEHAAELLRAALAELHGAAREAAVEHGRRAESLLADERARQAIAKAQAARAPHMALVDKRRLRAFADAVMDAARSRERSSVDRIERLFVAFVEEVEKAGASR